MHDYMLGLYEKALPPQLGWRERLAAAGETGFDYLEISIDETDERLRRLDWSLDERLDLLRAMSETGVRIESMCLSALRRFPLGHPDPAVRERGIGVLGAALELARDLGLRIVQIPGYDVYYQESTEQTRSLYVETLPLAIEMAARAGVPLGFETMELLFMDQVAKAMRYVRMFNSPYLGVYPDLGNVSNGSLISGVPVCEDIATGAGHIFAVHLKETVPGEYRDRMLGDGTTDYDGALSSLLPQGVRRFVCEVWCHGGDAWRDDLIATSRFARGKIEDAFRRLG